MRINDCEYHLERGTVVVFRPGDTLDGFHDPNDPLTVYCAHFEIVSRDKQQPVEINDALVPARVRRLEHIETIESMMQYYVNIADRDDALFKEEGPVLLQTIWSYLWRFDLSQQSASLEYLRQFLAPVFDRIKSYPEKRYKLVDMATLVGVSPDYLSRTCRRVTGLSYQSYCINVRMRQALLLLKNSPMAISEVAANLGYPDVYSFSHQFKKVHGISPRDYRK